MTLLVWTAAALTAAAGRVETAPTTSTLVGAAVERNLPTTPPSAPGPARPLIYLLDLALEHAAPLGLPQCSTDASVGWRDAILQRGHGGETDGGELEGQPVAHDFHKAQHSLEWWLWASAYHSMHRTLDIEAADVVLVHWWCYLRQGPLNSNVAAALSKMWRRVTASDHYRSRRGAQYVVVVPHPFFGRLFCSKTGSSPIRIVPEDRMVCSLDERRRRRLVVAPYLSLAPRKRATLAGYCAAASGALASAALTGKALPGAAQAAEVCSSTALAAHRRSLFLTFSGTCAPQAGKGLRTALVQELVAALHLPPAPLALPLPTIVLRCAHQQASPGAALSASHTELTAELRDSVFCFVLAGDSTSSRRITEAMLSGCLPVFVGPPFHNLPLADDVDYAAFTTTFWHHRRSWRDELDVFHKGGQPHRPGARWEGGVRARLGAVNVSSFGEVLEYLIALRATPGAVEALQAAMNPYQKLFATELFHRDLQAPANLNDALMHRVAHAAAVVETAGSVTARRRSRARGGVVP